MTPRDAIRLQFILDRVNAIGTDGTHEELKLVPWTVYYHDGDQSSIGFDRKAVDRWMKIAAARGAKLPLFDSPDPEKPKRRKRRKVCQLYLPSL
jgi:hypothetical protein